MRPLHMFYIGWGCIVLSIFIAAGPVLSLAFIGVGFVLAAVGEWVDKDG